MINTFPRIIKPLLNVIKKFFFAGNQRSIKAKKSILMLFMVKGYGVLVNLALIPLTLNLLDEYKFGVWITIFNVLSWIVLFDIGVGNGLRNKFTESVALGKKIEAREYVSTAYALMVLIGLVLICTFILPWLLLDWSAIFNVDGSMSTELFYLIGITFLCTIIQFGLKLITTLLTAIHKPGVAGAVMSISNSLVLILFILGGDFLSNNIVGIGFVYTLMPLIVLLGASIWFFSRELKEYIPSFNFVRKSKVKDLFSLGIQFFLIQVAVVIIFQTDTMIISHSISPDAVTPYNIVFRYFGVVSMLSSIVMTPFWSSYTDAAAKKDYIWIKRVVIKQLKLLMLLIVAVVGMVIFAKDVICLWVGEDIVFSNVLLFGMAVYTIISVWNNIFSFVLNGLSKTKVQLITSIVGMLINIPLSILLAKNLGNGGVILGTIGSLIIFGVFGSIEVYRVLNIRLNGAIS